MPPSKAVTPPINSVSDRILDGIASGVLAASPFEVVSIAKELAARRAANTPVGGVDQNLAREVHNLRKRLKGYIVNRGKHLDDRGAKDLSRASELLSAKFPTSPALPSQVVGVNLSDAATALERSLESEGAAVNAYLRDDIEQAIAAMRSCLTSPAAEPVAPSASREVTDPLDALAKHPRWEIDYGPSVPNDEESDYAWRVFEVSGNVNDREWTLLGFGDTPRAALLAALPEREG